MTSTDVLDAAGPEQIRTAFAAALDAAAGHSDDLTGLTRVLDAAADRYETLQMAASTLAHLRDAATGLAAAAALTGTGQQQLQAAAADFDARDGRVAQAVADAGNLMDAAGYSETFPPGPTAHQGQPGPRHQEETVDTPDHRAPTALPDTAGLTSTAEHWHGSEILTPAAGDGTVALGQCQYPDSAAYIVLATRPPGHRWEPDSNANGIDPALSPREAGQVADTLDELAALAESGTQVKPLTRLEKVAARVRDLIGTTGVNIAGDDGEIEVSAADMRAILDAAVPEPTVVTRRKVVAKAAEDAGMDSGAVWAELDTSGPEPVVTLTTTEGDPPEDYPEGYTPARLSPTEARQLADTVRRFAAPETPTAPTADRASMVAGQLLALTDRIRQRADHGVSDEQVDALFDGLSVAELKQVAEATGMPAGYLQRTRQDLIHYVRLNTVETALTARSIASVRIVDRHTAPPATPAPAAVPDPAVEQVRAQSEAAAPAPAPAGPRRVTSPAGRVYEVDPDSGQTAIIEPDGWRAVVPPTSTIGVAARLLDWRNEIKQGRGQDATADGARAMLATMTAFELREVAEAIGTTVPASRTKAQLVDAIVNSAVSSPLKHRGLAQGWW